MVENDKTSSILWFEKLYKFVLTDIFRLSESELTRPKRFLVRLLKKIVLAVRGFFDDDLMYRASALTYYSLLAIVPILALVIAIGRGFGLQKNIEEFIYTTFGEEHEITPYLMGFVDNYLEQAHGGVFVGIGVGILLWSVVSMFRQVEFNFNMIWHIKQNRSIVRQFTTYITMLLVIPILAVSSSGLSSIVDSYINSLATTTVGNFFMPLYHFFLQLIPYIIYWLLFTLVFLIVPNTKVKFLDALLAGVVTGTLFMLLKYFYVSGQINLSKYSAVYGSFAAIPLLLFWFQLSWLIILFGAEFAYVGQNLMNYNFEHESDNITRRYSDYTLIIVMKVIITHFEKGEQPISAYDISTKYNIPIRLVQDHLETLINIKLVSEIYIENSLNKLYQPAMDINKISLRMLMERLESFGSENFRILNAEQFKTTWETLHNIKNEYSKRNEMVLIKDL